MARRVLYNDEYIEIPAAVAAAIDRSPREYRRPTQREYREQHPVKAFANPNHAGYGHAFDRPDEGAPWPFDRRRAYRDGRYRAGIRNAINATWTASNWKYHARFQLDQIEADLAVPAAFFQ